MSRFAEWKVARDIISKFDDRTHSLRKSGFSFITALLTAESVLAATERGKDAEPGAKFAVLAVTLLLIVVLRLMERHYELIQEAVALRANILERSLNLELTEMISDKYTSLRINWIITVIYLAFAGAVVFLGVIAFKNEEYWRHWVLIAGAVAAVFIVVIRYFGLRYDRGMVDWGVGRTRCRQGELVTITLTNLGDPKECKGLSFEVFNQEDKSVWQPPGSPALPVHGTQIWTWRAAEAGVYRILVGKRPLRRKIVVLPRPTARAAVKA